jgi:hypothetical protein
MNKFNLKGVEESAEEITGWEHKSPLKEGLRYHYFSSDRESPHPLLTAIGEWHKGGGGVGRLPVCGSPPRRQRRFRTSLAMKQPWMQRRRLLEESAKMRMVTGARMAVRARVCNPLLEMDAYLRVNEEMNSNGFAESRQDLRAQRLEFKGKD